MWIPAGHGKLKLKKGAMVRQPSRGLIKESIYNQSHRGGRSKHVWMVRLTLQEYNFKYLSTHSICYNCNYNNSCSVCYRPLIKWLLSNPRIWSYFNFQLHSHNCVKSTNKGVLVCNKISQPFQKLLEGLGANIPYRADLLNREARNP